MNVDEAYGVMKAAQRELGVWLTFWHPHGRNGNLCETIEMGLSVPLSDELGHRIMQMVAQEYRIELGHFGARISDPEYDYYSIKTHTVEGIKAGINTLAKAREELEKRTSEMYNRLVDLVERH